MFCKKLSMPEPGHYAVYVKVMALARRTFFVQFRGVREGRLEGASSEVNSYFSDDSEEKLEVGRVNEFEKRSIIHFEMKNDDSFY